MTESSKERRERAFETAAIVAGFAGLVLALFGTYLHDERLANRPPATPPPVRGARLDAMGSTPAGAPISDASFAMAARFDRDARQGNGRLRLDHTDDGAYLRVPMSLLADFPYDPKPPPPGAAKLGIPAPAAAIPNEVLALDGKRVALVGFMVPLDVDRGGVQTFVLSQDRSYCCYGIKPALNEMVLVQMEEGGRAPFVKDTPIVVLGQLTVAEQRDGGFVSSLYRMKATRITSLRAYAQSAG